jgi:alpha-tubulin suppressor-like RCC1 family protein
MGDIRSGGCGFLAVNLGGLQASRAALGAQQVCIVAEVSGTPRVKCWGSNNSGQLGMGLTSYRSGGSQNNAIGDEAGELGTSSAWTPLELGAGYFRNGVYAPENYVSEAFVPEEVVAGSNVSCAISSARQVKCWGSAQQGLLGPGFSGLPAGDAQLIGDDPSDMGDRTPRIEFGAGRSVRKLALAHGAGVACAILDDDTLKCWGSNQQGVIGQGTPGTDASAAYGDATSEWGDGMPRVWLW